MRGFPSCVKPWFIARMTFFSTFASPASKTYLILVSESVYSMTLVHFLIFLGVSNLRSCPCRIDFLLRFPSVGLDQTLVKVLVGKQDELLLVGSVHCLLGSQTLVVVILCNLDQ